MANQKDKRESLNGWNETIQGVFAEERAGRDPFLEGIENRDTSFRDRMMGDTKAQPTTLRVGDNVKVSGYKGTIQSINLEEQSAVVLFSPPNKASMTDEFGFHAITKLKPRTPEQQIERQVRRIVNKALGHEDLSRKIPNGSGLHWKDKGIARKRIFTRIGNRFNIRFDDNDDYDTNHYSALVNLVISKVKEKEPSNLVKALETLKNLPVASASPVTLPNINDVSMAFHVYFMEMNTAQRAYGPREAIKWQEAIDESQGRLRDKLETMGLASRIDWTNQP